MKSSKRFGNAIMIDHAPRTVLKTVTRLYCDGKTNHLDHSLVQDIIRSILSSDNLTAWLLLNIPDSYYDKLFNSRYPFMGYKIKSEAKMCLSSKFLNIVSDRMIDVGQQLEKLCYLLEKQYQADEKFDDPRWTRLENACVALRMLICEYTDIHDIIALNATIPGMYGNSSPTNMYATNHLPKKVDDKTGFYESIESLSH